MKSKMVHNFAIDQRSKQDVLEEIRTLSKSYTPEWKFDTDNPDAGSVIGMIYANQTADNIRRLNRVIEKYHTEFANMYGVSLRAARPAESVVTLTVNDNVASGVNLKKGTQVMGENELGEEITFAFLHDLYVTSAKLTDVIAISGEQGKMIPLYGDFQKIKLPEGNLEAVLPEATEEPENMPVFSYTGENMNRQALLLYHHYMFAKLGDTIAIKVTGKVPSEQLASILTKLEEFTFSYLTETGLCPFEQVSRRGDLILLKREQEEARPMVNGTATSVIVLEKTGNSREEIIIDGLEIVHENQEELPDFLWNNKSELDTKTCCPFGNQLALYDECYIGQSYLMEQAGAVLSLQFDLSFDTFSLKQTAIYEPNLSVVKRKQKASAMPIRYECFIQEVSVEYFNGKGWKKLPCTHEGSSIFAREENAGRQEITFSVPDDWETTTQGGYEGRCIRIQVTRADNCYLQDVTYHYPILKDISMRLEYQKKGTSPEIVKRVQGNQIEDITGILHREEVAAFSKGIYQGDYVFLGFDRRFEQGPISFFLDLQERLAFHGLSLAYAYSTHNGFKPLKVVDETNQLEHSGTLMFMPPSDFDKQMVGGENRYWIRIEDTTHYFANELTKCPVIKHLYCNAAKVQNVENKEEQDYYIDRPESNMHFDLYADNILSVEVWVNEKEQLSVPVMEQLLRETPEQVRAEYNFMGEIEEFYVLWHEIESFDMATLMERCYLVDRFKNEVIFGDGVLTRIPQNTRSIAFKTKVVCCSGDHGNVKAYTIDKFRGAIFSIDGVANPVDAYGGNHIEDIKEALHRGSNILGTRKRLVSERDYIRETQLFSENIAQVACVTGVTKEGLSNSSVISLVILMKDYQNGSYSFRNIAGELGKHLHDCCEITCKRTDLEIVEPIFVKISLHIWMTIPDLQKSIEIKQHWMEHITGFFEPVGEHCNQELRIGKLPNEKQIRLMLSTLEEEAYISYYTISAVYTDALGTHEVSLEKVADNPFMICSNGEHQIHMSER